MPSHLTQALAHIFGIRAVVDIAGLPLEYAIAVLVVGLELAFILVAIRSIAFLPLAVAVLETLFEVAKIASSIGPLVLSEPFRFALDVLPVVLVAIRKDVCPLPVLERIQPFSLVAIAILPLVHSVALNFTFRKFAHIRVTETTLPDAVPVLLALDELPVVDFAGWPRQDALAVRFIIAEHPDVLVTVRKQFKPFALPLFVLPLAFIDPAGFIDKNTETVASFAVQASLV